MVQHIIYLPLLFASAPGLAQIVKNDGSKTSVVSLKRTGVAKVELGSGRHHATVYLTVIRTPKHWPSSMRIGPSTLDMRYSSERDRIISKVAIRVGGCLVDQPWPRIAGFVMPDSASLQFVKNHWQLAIGGGDGAEAYNVTYAFNRKSVTAREALWGPDFSEETNYDVGIDQDVSPRECVITVRQESTIRRKPVRGH